MTYRNERYLLLLRAFHCMLQVPGFCLKMKSRHSVACHSNLQRHERGKDHKSADVFAVAGCVACHAWLDSGIYGTREEKEAAFVAALERTQDLMLRDYMTLAPIVNHRMLREVFLRGTSEERDSLWLQIWEDGLAELNARAKRDAKLALESP